MIAFVLGRTVYAVSLLLGVATVVFALIHLGGDPLTGLVPPGSSPEQTASLRRHYGLDRSIPEQYLTFLGRAARGDLGESWRQDRPALDAVLERLPATLALATTAIALAVIAGGGLALLSAIWPRRGVGSVVTLLATLGQAMPGFWLGTVLIVIFAVRLGWLPPSGSEGPRSLILPAVTLAIAPAAVVARLLGSSLRETLRGEFVRTAHGKGLRPAAVVFRHALRNAIVPTLAYVGVQIGFLLGGAIVVEAVFAYPGLGRLALGAVADRDIPLIQAVVVVVAALIVAVNLAVEVVSRWLDPRLRVPETSARGHHSW